MTQASYVATDHDGMSDETLAAHAKDGDRRSFEVLVKRYKAPLYRFVRRYVGQSDDAYDVLQESFISAWRSLHRYDPEQTFGPWLRTIALNKCRDFGRRQKVRRLLLQNYAGQLPDFPEIDTSDAQHMEELAESQRISMLDNAIATLPKKYKEPLLLTTVGGLSHQEAATILKTTPKAIEVRLYRARKKLREIIEPL